MWKDALLVGLGAALGATARYAVFLEAPLTGIEVHVLTTLVNALSCFAMGFFAPGKFWGMGVLGGFSTLSAVSLAAAQSSPAGAAATLVSSFAACMAAWFAGDALRGRRA
ncbi:CrcB family protein [Corynebacterium senegalense]|uniref:CrcB family protein n=1 Tax=Corynebacterium senegalense TaxID=2080750 RepID=UPI000E20C38E|nr:CrcB family protein [Corynebacterium senegalense]